MPFLSLSLYNFRNLHNQTIDLLSREVYFTGLNGQGKSNLLEALYYSAYGSSFRTHNDSESIKNGQTEMSIRVLFREENNITHSTVVSIKNNKKKIEKDGKILHDRKELINTIPCILYNHDDLDFAVGEPERRRFFIDQSLSMYDEIYLDLLRNYKKILKNRNISLKERKYELLDIYDKQLAINGIEIQKKRKNTVFQFNQIFADIYEKVTGIEGVKIKYIPSWKKTGIENSVSQYSDLSIPCVEEIIEYLNKKREIEKEMGTTMSGPHRDKIIFTKNEKIFVPTASTGQRRLLALVLRNAQAHFYKRITGKNPVLLMDDVMLELDPEKREKVTSLLPDYDQLFCTFLPGEPYERYKTDKTKIFEIENGGWKEKNV